MSDIRKTSPNVRKKNALRENLEAIAWAVVLALVIRTFVIEPYKIPTGSMKPTLLGVEYNGDGEKEHGGDKILANKFIYYFKKPQRGDIVIFTTKGIEGIDPKKKDFVKRLVGLPGDTVEIRDGRVYIDGKMLTEPGVFKGITYIGEIGNAAYGTTGNPVKVPDGCYFMLGDNSANSNDSRYWGFVPKKNIKGRAMLIYWPVTRWRMLK